MARTLTDSGMEESKDISTRAGREGQIAHECGAKATRCGVENKNYHKMLWQQLDPKYTPIRGG